MEAAGLAQPQAASTHPDYLSIAAERLPILIGNRWRLWRG